MAEEKYAFDRQDLKRLDKQLKQIEKACEELSAFSAERGGIAVLDRNVERINALLRILQSITEALQVMPRPSKERIYKCSSCFNDVSQRKCFL
jgi:hypothetical protein